MDSRDNSGVFITKGIAGGGVLHTNCRGNITRINSINILAVVCVHLQNPADSLIAVLCGVVNRSARTQCTGVHTEVAQLTNKWVNGNLKCKCREGLIVGSMTILFLASLRVDTLD